MKLKSTLLILGAMVIGGSPLYADPPEKMCPTIDSIKAAVFTTRTYEDFRPKKFTKETQTFYVISASYLEARERINPNVTPVNRLTNKSLDPTETWKQVTQVVLQDQNPKITLLEVPGGVGCHYGFEHSGNRFVIVLETRP